MAVRSFFCTLLLMSLSACAVFQTERVSKIALLAPFEGQYREIGYDALYASRLAISESGVSGVDLLAIDDGGSIDTARLRMQAIMQDPSIVAVIASGLYATSPEAMEVIHDIPVLIPGHWNASPVHDGVFLLASPEIDTLLNFEGEITEITNSASLLSGTEMLALEQVPLLLDDVSDIQIFSSASLPDDDFRERYLNSAEFAPEPGLTASLVYDATDLILQSIQTNTPVDGIVYEGINGHIQFENGYWSNAPINEFVYDGSQLVLRP